jgi:hypothetical protein
LFKRESQGLWDNLSHMTSKLWYGRPIASESHVDGLETAAALKEFGEGLPRSEAEAQAHDEYLKDIHSKAAAHHLRGMRAAQAAGDLDEAGLHGEAYANHLEALGHDPMEAVPESVQKLVDSESKPTSHRFKTHAADCLLSDNTVAPPQE